VTRDPLGAFVLDNNVERPGAASGPLAGLAFGAKDVFDISGSITGAGQPDWLRTHGPADGTAPTVERLLDAGARLAGKTQTDELTYSLNGENVHYGTPVNPCAPDRIPGGSSSGSASAVAGGLVDFAMGTDCGGSTRLPSSYCGILGIRPSHGRIPTERVFPLAPSFDTVGWFAREATVLERVGQVLLGETFSPGRPRRVLLARDAFDLAGPRVREALGPAVDRVVAAIGPREEVVVHPAGLRQLGDRFRVLQAFEIWATHGEWVTRVKPSFGPGISERFAWASTLTSGDVAGPRAERETFAARMDELLRDDTILCLPTVPGIAPRLRTPTAQLEDFRGRAMSLLAIAGLARLPQISLPLGTLDGCPLGLSLVGRRGTDPDLLALAVALRLSVPADRRP
jgi:amidase